MEQGYVKLWRKSIQTKIFKNQNMWQFWTWCLMKANHSQTHVSVTTGRGSKVVTLAEGQFIFGRNSASEALGMKPSTVRNCLVKLKSIGNLVTQVDTHFTIITVCNYRQYNLSNNTGGQVEGQPSDNQVTTKGQPKDTDKNDKNDKNKNKKKNKKESIYISGLGEFGNVKIEKQEYDKLLVRFGEKPTFDYIERLSIYIEQTGRKYKSHYATILAWSKKNETRPIKYSAGKSATRKTLDAIDNIEEKMRTAERERDEKPLRISD